MSLLFYGWCYMVLLRVPFCFRYHKSSRAANCTVFLLVCSFVFFSSSFQFFMILLRPPVRLISSHPCLVQLLLLWSFFKIYFKWWSSFVPWNSFCRRFFVHHHRQRASEHNKCAQCALHTLESSEYAGNSVNIQSKCKAIIDQSGSLQWSEGIIFLIFFYSPLSKMGRTRAK